MTVQTFNVDMTLANTEYSQKVPSNTKYLLIRTRNGLDDLKLSHVQGQSGSVYMTIPATSTKTIVGSPQSSLSDLILYFQSATPDMVEIETWQ
jgi:hypothetical protein